MWTSASVCAFFGSGSCSLSPSSPSSDCFPLQTGQVRQVPPHTQQTTPVHHTYCPGRGHIPPGMVQQDTRSLACSNWGFPQFLLLLLPLHIILPTQTGTHACNVMSHDIDTRVVSCAMSCDTDMPPGSLPLPEDVRFLVL